MNPTPDPAVDTEAGCSATGSGLVRGVAGLLLTGGASRRMGRDKATIEVNGIASAVRLGQILSKVIAPAFEVGPGRSGLFPVHDAEPDQGPLVALAAGWASLRAAEHRGPVVVLACDLGLLSEDLIRFLAQWPGDHSVVPVVDGRPQPLCARWSEASLASAAAHVANGERSLHPLLAGRFAPGPEPGSADAPASVEFLHEDSWSQVADARCFEDFDTPADLDRLRRHLGRSRH
ncbi:MAG: molybdenum cofactor guanylyltransferase [Acidimicrobiales bacterium]